MAYVYYVVISKRQGGEVTSAEVTLPEPITTMQQLYACASRIAQQKDWSVNDVVVISFPLLRMEP